MTHHILRIVAAGTALLAAGLLSEPVFGAAAFLTPEQYEPAKLLPPPPAEDTEAAKAELGELHRIEDTRLPTQLERAKIDDKTENASIFAEAIGSGFDLKSLPATAKMLADVRRDEQAAANAAKAFFKRHRPWIVDASLKSCSKQDAPESSYPSGHSTMGYAMATVLASLAPEKAQAIFVRASEYAENRLVCGMHFRRDIEAGHVLGTAVAIKLMQTPEFHAEYEASEAELRRAHLIGP